MAEQNAAVQKQPQLPIAEGESSTDTKEIASITNIYYDCLEHIFAYLDLRSLMNLAGTCKRLKVAAAAKFNDDHGKKVIMLVPTKYESFVSSQPHSIVVCGLNFCRSFLWSFGAKISNVYFDEIERPNFFESLEQDINKYCANSLETLKFGYRQQRQTFSLENNPKPFQHIKKITMKMCDLHGQFANVNTLFPNLRHLTLKLINVDEDFSVAVSIPQLVRLKITLSSHFNFGLKESTDLIKANPQLQVLQFRDFNFLEVKLANILDMISGNASISKLSVNVEFANVTCDELMRFAAEHPLMIDVNFGCYQMTANDVIVFVSKLDSLQRFQFKLVDGSQYDVLKKTLEKEWKIKSYFDDPMSDRTTCVLER